LNNTIVSIIRSTVRTFPAVIPHLKGRARYVTAAFSSPPGLLRLEWESAAARAFCAEYINATETKTYDYFLAQLERLIRSVYNGNLGGEFIDITANLISGQIYQAVNQAWLDSGMDGELPDYLNQLAESIILGQYDHVDQLYRDIVDARVDGTPIGPLLARAPLWANRWNEAYNQALQAITAEMGGRLIWKLGATETHCETCAALDGIVAFATEWDELGVKPQSAPNDALECGGWRCDCTLLPTDQRRSPDAYGRIMNATTKI